MEGEVGAGKIEGDGRETHDTRRTAIFWGL